MIPLVKRMVQMFIDRFEARGCGACAVLLRASGARVEECSNFVDK
jgi:hypothetical protein